MVRSIVRLHGKNMHTLTAENLSCLEERLIILDRGHPAQTAGRPIGSKTIFLPKNPCRACRLRTRAVPDFRPGNNLERLAAGGPVIRNPNHSLTDSDGLWRDFHRAKRTTFVLDAGRRPMIPAKEPKSSFFAYKRTSCKIDGLYPLLVADYFPPTAHHEKGGCTPASPDRRPPPPPLFIFLKTCR